MSTSARTSAQPAFGLKLPDRYRVKRHIATGGMASVWCAEDRVLGRSVAIKVLSDRFANDGDAVRRFMREARAAARVSNHPHVVTIYDVGDIEPDANDPISRAFIVMEFLAGGTVADALRVKAVAPSETRQWISEAASALDHAHQRGIVHRDIKPANFLLDGSRSLHVADFGIAHLQSEDTITSTGQLFGTAAYLAPEQALGKEATGASDRYALAVAAFELLTGGRPFTATHFAAQARQHIEDAPPPASEREASLPPAVDAVLARGMAKEPAERYPTARAFNEELDHALDSAPTVATEPITARTEPMRPKARRRGGGALAAGGLAAGGLAAGGLAAGGLAAAAGSAGAGAAPAASRVPAAALPPRRNSGNNRNDPIPRAATSSAPAPRSGRALALTALVIVLIGVVALLTQLNSGGSPSPAGQHHPSALAANHPRVRHHRAAKKPAAAASPSSTVSASSSTSAVARAPAPATTGAANSPASAATGADALNSLGNQQLQSGQYQQAIGNLEKAVASAPHSGLTYAYALYNLGHALLLSGNPQAAIPILQQRLQIPNQTATVQALLNQAEQAAGQSTSSAGTGAARTGQGGKAKGHGGGSD